MNHFFKNFTLEEFRKLENIAHCTRCEWVAIEESDKENEYLFVCTDYDEDEYGYRLFNIKKCQDESFEDTVRFLEIFNPDLIVKIFQYIKYLQTKNMILKSIINKDAQCIIDFIDADFFIEE